MRVVIPVPRENGEQLLDLKMIGDAVREMLTQMRHEAVVDLERDKGGVLETDEDNSDPFRKSGFDALLETK